jgi:hypothetical protein
MDHHPGLVREIAARHSRGAARMGRFCACEKLVIRRPKRSSITGRPTARSDTKPPKVVALVKWGPFGCYLASGECGACSRTEVQWCFLVSGHHYSPFPAAPSLRSSEARTGLLAFRKIDLDVYRSRGLYAPGAMREVALAKSRSFAT